MSLNRDCTVSQLGLITIWDRSQVTIVNTYHSTDILILKEKVEK